MWELGLVDWMSGSEQTVTIYLLFKCSVAAVVTGWYVLDQR